MRLALKVVASVVSGIIVILAVDATVSVNREVRAMESEMEHEAQTLGRAVSGMVADVLKISGEQRVAELISDANQAKTGINIRWVSFDAAAETVDRPSVPLDKLGVVREDGHVSSINHAAEDGLEYLYTYVPVHLDGQREGALELAQSRGVLTRRISSTIKRALLLSAAMVLIGGSVVVLIGVSLVGQPLRAVIEKTQRAGAGDLDGPIHIAGRDELSELAESLNEMCENLAVARHKAETETQARISVMDELRHADRLVTVGQLAAGVAHELGTPLNVVTGRASLILAGKLPGAQVKESAAVIKTEGERMATIIRQLLEFGRRRVPRRAATRVGDLVRETESLVRPLCANDVKFEIVIDGEVVIDIDPAQIQQVLINLVMNGIQSMHDGGLMRIQATQEFASRPHTNDAQECIRIDVIDDGSGIPAATIERLFEPFFTTKDVGAGTGLGLSVAHGIVEDHHGWISVESEPGVGSCFSVFLPVSEIECHEPS